jgi:hypothetical protein
MICGYCGKEKGYWRQGCICLSATPNSSTSSTGVATCGPMYHSPTILSASLNDGKIQIVKRAEAMFPYFTSYPSQTPPPKIWRETYAVIGDKILLTKIQDATFHPQVPEWYSWEV